MMDDLSPEIRRLLADLVDPPMMREFMRQEEEMQKWLLRLPEPTPAEITRLLVGLSPEELAKMVGLSPDELAKMAMGLISEEAAKLAAGPSPEQIKRWLGDSETAQLGQTLPAPAGTPKPYEQVEEEVAIYFAQVLLPLTDRERARLWLTIRQIFLAIVHPDQPSAPEPPES
jgi:hypothetical protein